MVSGVWSRIPSPLLPLAGQTLSVVADKAYIFGGEGLKARQPMDNGMHIIDLNTGTYHCVESPDAPPPRTGHTAVAIGKFVFIFGGRGYGETTPLEEKGTVYAFDTCRRTWTVLDAAVRAQVATKGDSRPYPVARSYHTMAGTDSHLIVHAGCAATGRLKDTWAFDLDSQTWAQLPDAPGLPRGGSTLCYANGRLWRFGGFSGTSEIGGSIDSLDLRHGIGRDVDGLVWSSHEFESVPPSNGHSNGSVNGQGYSNGSGNGYSNGHYHARRGPEGRSVFGLHAIGDEWLLAAYGVGAPPPKGASRGFWGDAWVYDVIEDRWQEIELSAVGPSPRGWFGSSMWRSGVVLHGGLDAANQKQGDTWVLRLQ